MWGRKSGQNSRKFQSMVVSRCGKMCASKTRISRRRIFQQVKARGCWLTVVTVKYRLSRQARPAYADDIGRQSQPSGFTLAGAGVSFASSVGAMLAPKRGLYGQGHRKRSVFFTENGNDCYRCAAFCFL